MTEYRSTGHIHEIRENQNELVILTTEGQKRFSLNEVASLIALANILNRDIATNDWLHSRGVLPRAKGLIQDAYVNGDPLAITLEEDGINLPTITNRQQAVRLRGVTNTIDPNDPALRQAFRQAFIDILRDGFAQLPAALQARTTPSEHFTYITYDTFKHDMLEAQQYGDEYLTRFKKGYLVAQQFRLCAKARTRDEQWNWSWDQKLEDMLDGEQYKALKDVVAYERKLQLAANSLSDGPRPVLQIERMTTELSRKLILLARLSDTPRPDETQISHDIGKAIGDEKQSREYMLKELAHLESQSELGGLSSGSTNGDLEEVRNALVEIQKTITVGEPLSSGMLQKLKGPLEKLDQYKKNNMRSSKTPFTIG